ncbi:DUF5686 and carboxypeptidase-like regulatory domain-containing protein [Parapedobacter tibetensis]|uniref:DUF5686 and carboxypeptidase-like regulatory domain-containing protein n=1 Tax=Parapedobacter tibetensis TaxID=2972951 RepID=UPI00214DE6C1|nr:DUF5686 and carboxypeptidase-like regulatory domain-containing protein [Parapedobacter tibetensis]
MTFKTTYFAIKTGIGLLAFILLCNNILAQTTTIKGVIKDKNSKETLPYVSVAIVGGLVGSGTSADEDGRYQITVSGNLTTLRFSYIGYLPIDTTITPGQDQTIDIAMEVDATMMEEVVISGRRRYRNRDNPAVQLIRKVIEHKEENQLEAQEYVQYEQYEKVSFALSNLSEKFKNRRIFKNYQFLFNEQDSSTLGGKYTLPAYMHEKLSQIYFRKSPQKRKQYILAEKRAEFDSKFIDNDGLTEYFNRLYEDINIYDNNISLLTNLLLSPIANSSPTFYKFFITDTIKTNDPWLVELSFVPRNKTDLLFTGKLYVTLDGNYAVQEAYFTVAEDINLNFVRDMEVTLEFEKDPNGRYYLDKSVLAMEFGLGEKGGGVYGRRMVNYKDFQVDIKQPDSIYDGPAEEIAYKEEEVQQEAYWRGARHIPLEKKEDDIYKNIDTLQTIRSFRRFMDISTVLIAGYKSFGPVEVGPVNTFYSFNPVEGFRLRIGGRTTSEMSKRFYAETYAAYGFNDEKWKYFLSGTYSLNNKSIYTFPQHYLRASYQKDTKIPGQDLQFVQEDNFLLSFKRGDNYRWLYNDIYRLEYLHELANNFSYGLELTKWRQQPAGILTYQLEEQGNLRNYSELNTTEISLRLRYAPNEQFYQGKAYRVPIFNKYPILTLNYTAGLKGFLDGEYDYHNVSAGIFKRVYLSQLGYADVNLEGTYIFGDGLPFPLLSIHRANQTYAYQLNAYNLMNFLEFVSDHHAAVNVQYYMNGFLFNKIPLLKRLKLREVFSFKGIWGALRAKNNPAHNNEVFQFQQNEDGIPISYTLHRGPYIEASAGVANVFKFLRIDAVRRFTYLNNPDVPKWGIRARFKFDF